jgi:hypothetical protein
MAQNNPNTLTGTGQQSLFTKDGEYIAPVIAQMYAAASATYGTLQKSKVTITNIDEIFGYVLSEAESAKLLNLFRVADADQTGTSGLLDSSANVTVSIIGDMSDGFKEVIVKALNSAKSEGNHVLVNSTAAATNQIPANYLRLKAYEDTKASLNFDTLANMLAADDLASFSMALDVSGGAKSLVAKLDDINVPAARRAMYTQLPEYNTEAYLTPQDISGIFSAEGINAIDFLPFLVGDKFVCVFDTTIGETNVGENTPPPNKGAAVTRESADGAVPNSKEQATEGAAGGNLMVDDSTTSAFADGTLRFSAPTRRRIALALMVSREADGSGMHNVRDGYVVPNKGASLKLKFKPEQDSAVEYYIDSSANHYDAAVAAGMLSNTAGNIALYAGTIQSAQTGPGPLDSKPSTYTVNANLSDLSDGVNWVDVSSSLTGLAAVKTSPHYGAFAIIAQAGAKNAYKMVHEGSNAWKLQVNALVETATADQITIRYVENTGRTEDLAISVNVDVNFSA